MHRCGGTCRILAEIRQNTSWFSESRNLSSSHLCTLLLSVGKRNLAGLCAVTMQNDPVLFFFLLSLLAFSRCITPFFFFSLVIFGRLPPSPTNAFFLVKKRRPAWLGLHFTKKYYKDVSREFDEFRVNTIGVLIFASCVVGTCNILCG